MRQKAIQLFLFFLISVFTGNMVADCVLLHKRAAESKCCDVNTQVQKEFEFRMRTFEPSDRILSDFEFCFLQFVLNQTETAVTQFKGTRAFFPYASHVPIYMGKCSFLI